jgi:hypothetical protein
LSSFDDRLGAVCVLIAIYNFAAAFELWRSNGERLPSSLPAIILLGLTGLGYLSWLTLDVAMPIQESQWVALSLWFPSVILGTLLLRITLAFIVLPWRSSAGKWSVASMP